jgi:hypothetical protein
MGGFKILTNRFDGRSKQRVDLAELDVYGYLDSIEADL